MARGGACVGGGAPPRSCSPRLGRVVLGGRSAAEGQRLPRSAPPPPCSGTGPAWPAKRPSLRARVRGCACAPRRGAARELGLDRCPLPSARRARPARPDAFPPASVPVPSVFAAGPGERGGRVTEGAGTRGLATRGWDSCRAHDPRAGSGPGPPAPRTPCAPRPRAARGPVRAPRVPGLETPAPQEPRGTLGPLRPKSPASRVPYATRPCAPRGPLRSPRTCAPGAPVHSTHPLTVRGRASGALPLAEPTLGVAFASCCRSGAETRGSSGSWGSCVLSSCSEKQEV